MICSVCEESKQEQKEEPAVTIIPPKQAVVEMLIELKKLKNRKDELLFPINDELEEIEEKKEQICNEITACMQELQNTVRTDDGAAIWKLMPKPREIYDTKALDAITDKEIREVLDACKKMTQQGEPIVKFEIY